MKCGQSYNIQNIQKIVWKKMWNETLCWHPNNRVELVYVECGPTGDCPQRLWMLSGGACAHWGYVHKVQQYRWGLVSAPGGHMLNTWWHPCLGCGGAEKGTRRKKKLCMESIFDDVDISTLYCLCVCGVKPKKYVLSKLGACSLTISTNEKLIPLWILSQEILSNEYKNLCTLRPAISNFPFQLKFWNANRMNTFVELNNCWCND